MELRAEKITRRYFRQGKGTNVFTAVQETDLLLEAGKLTEIAGRSGSGKSTLLNMLAGLLEPTSGSVFLDGTDLYALSDEERARLRNRSMGIIPQGQTALRTLTVLENVLLPSGMYPAGEKDALTPEEREHRADTLLEDVHIAHLREVFPDELSGGERRRLAIARALIMQPGILLADEPTADLDDGNTKEVLQLLRKCADGGMAVLLVTHEPEATGGGSLCRRRLPYERRGTPFRTDIAVTAVIFYPVTWINGRGKKK